MCEYVTTTVTIGGSLAGPEAVAGLIAAASRYFGESKRLVREALAGLVREALADGGSVIFEDLQDFGLTPTLDAFCQAQGLTQRRAWFARPGVFEAGLCHWRPGLDSPVAEMADQSGEPVLTLAALRNCHKAGRSLADVLARLAEALSTAVPPLTLVTAGGAVGQVPA